jgi:Dolichyl-phosphate-mannose-protein mannosyltransferase
VKPFAAFLLSLTARAGYLWWQPPGFAGEYWDLSTSLREHGTLALDGVRTARFEPLYPLFLAGARALTHDSVPAVQLLQCGVASLGAVFLFFLASRLANNRVALVASLLFAVHPLLVRHAADLSDSALSTTALLLFICVFVRAGSVAAAASAGACLGLAVLVRSVVLPMAVLAPLLLVAGRRSAHAIALAGAALVVITPMLARDYALSGSIVPPRSGVNLFVGNSEYSAAVLPEHSPDILQHYADRLASDALGGMAPESPGFADRADAVLADLAWTQVKTAPFETIALKLRNVWYFLSPFLVPSHLLLPDTTIALEEAGHVRVERAPIRPPAERMIFTAFSSVVLVMALAGIVIRGRALRRDAVLWCALVTFVVVYSVYFPATRYTAPVVFVAMFYAAVAVDRALPV